jgi:hypothetical protein
LPIVGAAEDDVKAGTLAEAKARLDLLSLAGLQAVRVTAIWDPADPHPTADMLLALNNLTAAAKLDAIDVFVSVYNFGSRTTPLTDEQQASFANFAAELATGVPDLQKLHHRQRAEPEPLLTPPSSTWTEATRRPLPTSRSSLARTRR